MDNSRINAVVKMGELKKDFLKNYNTNVMTNWEDQMELVQQLRKMPARKRLGFYGSVRRALQDVVNTGLTLPELPGQTQQQFMEDLALFAVATHVIKKVPLPMYRIESRDAYLAQMRGAADTHKMTEHAYAFDPDAIYNLADSSDAEEAKGDVALNPMTNNFEQAVIVARAAGTLGSVIHNPNGIQIGHGTMHGDCDTQTYQMLPGEFVDQTKIAMIDGYPFYMIQSGSEVKIVPEEFELIPCDGGNKDSPAEEDICEDK